VAPVAATAAPPDPVVARPVAPKPPRVQPEPTAEAEPEAAPKAEPDPAPEAEEPEAAPEAKAEPAAEAKPEPPGPPAWEDFEGTLSDKTRLFLRLISERRTLRLEDALAELGMKAGKSIGGMTGALSRKAANHGVALPFTQRKDKKGIRIWVAKADYKAPPRETTRVFRRPGRKTKEESAQATATDE